MAASRATYAREWRFGRRQKRRLEVLATDYIATKYPDIYEEALQFYEMLNTKHEGKHNLTKAKEYREWKSQWKARTTNNRRTGNSETPNQHGITENNDPAIETSEHEHGISENNETNNEPTMETSEHEHGISENNETNNEPTMETSEHEHGITENNKPTMETSEHGITENNDPTMETSEHGIHEDLLTIAAEGLLQQNDLQSDLDNIINDIVNDLRQDAVLRDILDNDYVQPHYADEDEGLGLDVEVELDAITEPFDFSLEVEPYEW